MPRKMTDSEREAFLAAKHVGIISVAAGDGKPPFAVPIWYAYDPGGLVTIHTGPRSRKARLIRAAGSYALSVQDEEPPYKYVTVSGPVVETVDDADAGERLALAQRYLGEEVGRGFMAQTGGDPRSAFRMRPTTWWNFDFS
ncbi:MAG: pyridoxamine 5'-phosphate oxidase family protein [Candidatus Dormibacteraeota bacterium]|nr:pyridoxamine 5'-phosphate oxidase family protein [Candidatus Dormibacteraeota bacterium]